MSDYYGTARAFRQALEERLKQYSIARKIELARLRRVVAFERLLARLFPVDSIDALEDTPWLLKGGYALEMRLGSTARTTRDIDLSVPDLPGSPGLPGPSQTAGGRNDRMEAIRERLQEAVDRDLADWFTFRIGSPIADLDAAPYGGARFPVEALLDNRSFARYHLDVGLGDAVVSPPEWITGTEILEFAGIAPARVASLRSVLPIEQHFAEKIHAYTLPRGEQANTRIKDLIDLVLLIDMNLPQLEVVVQAMRATFERRSTHEIPAMLPTPPASWQGRYEALAGESGAGDRNLNEAFAELSAYWATLNIYP